MKKPKSKTPAKRRPRFVYKTQEQLDQEYLERTDPETWGDNDMDA